MEAAGTGMLSFGPWRDEVFIMDWPCTRVIAANVPVVAGKCNDNFAGDRVKVK
jgi:hypothetical protein